MERSKQSKKDLVVDKNPLGDPNTSKIGDYSRTMLHQLIDLFNFANKQGNKKISAECLETMDGVANNKPGYSALITNMINFSGREFNDLGKYYD